MAAAATRFEVALVLALFAAGFSLRAAAPSRMAVEHFDEGVYASNLYSDAGRYPFQHLYAPPLLPFCLEWAAIFGGPQAVMWVNVVSGSLTLLVLWGMIREWWGPPAAIAAMALLAFNEFHIAYSRAALTDAMLGLWMTAGVWAGWRAIRFGGPANLAAAGVLASLAWWTKYNGWLTLAITGAGTAGWILFGGARAELASGGRQPPDESPRKSTSPKGRKASGGSRPPLASVPKGETRFSTARLYFGRWLITALIALLLWSPWLWSLQQYGGYAAVAKNHAGYFTGLSEWQSNATRQSFALARYLAGWSFIGLLLAGSAQALVHPAFGVSAAEWKRQNRPWQNLKSALRHLGFWLLAAWTLGLTVAVPMYAPYPRISLPWVIAAPVAVLCLLLILGGTATTSQDVPATIERKDVRRQVKYLIYGLFLALLPGIGKLALDGAGLQWEDRASLQKTSRDIVTQLESEALSRDFDGVRCAVSVVAEPGLFFHLSAAQRDSQVGYLPLPAADYDIARAGGGQSDLPLYVVVGPHAEASHPGEADRLIAAGRLEPVAEFEYRPSHLVLLDSRPAWELPPKDQPVVERIRLLHVKP